MQQPSATTTFEPVRMTMVPWMVTAAAADVATLGDGARAHLLEDFERFLFVRDGPGLRRLLHARGGLAGAVKVLGEVLGVVADRQRRFFTFDRDVRAGITFDATGDPGEPLKLNYRAVLRDAIILTAA